MQPQYSIDHEGLQASAAVAEVLSRRLTTFVQPLLVGLDALLDLRLVQTFLATLHVLLEFRHRNNGLPLSELGAYLASPDHATAGTKRLSNRLAFGQVGFTAHRGLPSSNRPMSVSPNWNKQERMAY